MLRPVGREGFASFRAQPAGVRQAGVSAQVMRTKNPGGEAALERGQPTRGSFKTRHSSWIPRLDWSEQLWRAGARRPGRSGESRSGHPVERSPKAHESADEPRSRRQRREGRADAASKGEGAAKRWRHRHAATTKARSRVMRSFQARKRGTRRPVEDRRGENPGGSKRQESSGRARRVTPTCAERTGRMRAPTRLRPPATTPLWWKNGLGRNNEVREVSREVRPATWQGKALETESHGRERHETRPQGAERNEASRGCENLRTPHSRSWMLRCQSLLCAGYVVGKEIPREDGQTRIAAGNGSGRGADRVARVIR